MLPPPPYTWLITAFDDNATRGHREAGHRETERQCDESRARDVPQASTTIHVGPSP